MLKCMTSIFFVQPTPYVLEGTKYKVSTNGLLSML